MTTLTTPENIDEWLPPQRYNADSNMRRVGIEIELAGVDAKAMTDSLMDLFGGILKTHSATEMCVEDSALGSFTIELDSEYLKSLYAPTEAINDAGEVEPAHSMLASDILLKAAEHFVPWEIVSPPIPLTELPHINRLIDALRQQGALGTRHALRYAFGVHLNPELPSLKTETIVNYLKAYLCLYDWIAMHERVDTTRKLTSYINHFDKAYIAKVIHPDYAPSQEGLIDDYIQHNPTRNRSLDLLPLFTFIDEQRVRNAIDDPRIKSRPTFHYRLPNCDIDNPNWNIYNPWKLWLAVESLANDPSRLYKMCDEYQLALDRLTHAIDDHWAQRTITLLTESE